jgi:hypothetical protein
MDYNTVKGWKLVTFVCVISYKSGGRIQTVRLRMDAFGRCRTEGALNQKTQTFWGKKKVVRRRIYIPKRITRRCNNNANNDSQVRWALSVMSIEAKEFQIK